jgi:hypothetical protein
VEIMAGQLSEDEKEVDSFRKLLNSFSNANPYELMKQSDFRGPIKEFVSHCRELKLPERVNEYRAKINAIEVKDPLSNIKGGGAHWLIFEIANQGDFESLELLEKDFPLRLKDAFWEGVVINGDKDDAKKLLVKWAKENPIVPVLMPYHPNGVNLLIEMAEDKNVPVDNRITCLHLLGSKRVTNDLDKIRATNALDRIKALVSDKSLIVFNNSWVGSDNKPENVAAQTVMEIELAIKLQAK